MSLHFNNWHLPILFVSTLSLLGASSCPPPEDLDGDGIIVPADCDDGNASIYPGAHDGCGDGIDADCDGFDPACGVGDQIDQADASLTLLFPDYTSITEYDGRGGVAVGDFDGDGVTDMAFGSGASYGRIAHLVYGPKTGVVEIDEGEASILRGANTQWSAESGHVYVAGDLDGDGDDELIVQMTEFLDDLTTEDFRELYYIFDAPSQVDLPMEEATWQLVTSTPRTRPIWPVAVRREAGRSTLAVLMYSDQDSSNKRWWVAFVEPESEGIVDVDSPIGTLELQCDLNWYCRMVATPDINEDGMEEFLIASDLGNGESLIALYESPFVGDIHNKVPTFSITVPGSIEPGGLTDLNEDGELDLVMTVPFHSEWYNKAGAMYVFYGPLSGELNLEDGIALYGETPLQNIGKESSLIPDINGDNRAEVIFGEPYMSSGTQHGAVNLHYGGDAWEEGAVSDAFVTGLGKDDIANFGSSVGFAGDMNADGFFDFFATDTRYNSDRRASVSVFFGGPRPDKCALGETDVDGDGVRACEGDCDDNNPDIAPGLVDTCGDGIDSDCDGKETRCQAGHVLSVENADVRFTGSLSGWDEFTKVAPAGDVNGDGLDDLWILGPGFGARLFLAPFAASIALDTYDVMVADALNETDFYGLEGTGAHDFNGDGHLDLLLVETLQNGDSVLRVYHGPFSEDRPAASADLTYESPRSDANGRLLSATGILDMNGDGASDLALTFYLGTSWVQLYSGHLSGTLDFNAHFAEIMESGDVAPWYSISLGKSVASAEDVNGDGYADLILGAPDDFPIYPSGEDYHASIGGAYVFFGPISGHRTQDSAEIRITGESLYVRAGEAVASAGDVNGDGLDDLIIGSTDAQYGIGRAHLLLSPHEGLIELQNNANRFDAHSPSLSAYYSIGSGFTPLGDQDGDGFDDLMISAPYYFSGVYDGTHLGAHFLVHGPWLGQILTEEADLQIVGDAQQYYLGYSATAIGDIDGDGKGDIAIGSQREHEVDAYEGAWIITGETLSGFRR